MPIRALIFLGIYGIALVAALFFPPAGVWGYLFEWYNHPPLNWWGNSIKGMFGNRWSFYIGAAMALGLILNYNRYSSIPFMKHLQTRLILLYSLNAFVVTLWAYDSNISFDVAVDHIKIFLVYWCIVKTQSDKKRVNILLLICIIGCIYWGWETTINPPGGRELKVGGPSVSSDNFVAAHIVAFLPLVGVYALTEKGWIRYMCIFGVPLMLNVVAHASSRGAFVALVAEGGVLFALSKGKLRSLVIIGLIIGSLLALRLFHEQFWERQQTLTKYEEDASAVGRIDAWKAAWILVKRNPFGYGGEAFDKGLAHPLMDRGFHTTHNMFFEVFVAWGIQGVIFLFGFILITCRNSYRLYRRYWDGISWPPPQEALIPFGICCGLISMLVSSLFLNRYRWELWWIFSGGIVCLQNIQAFGTRDKHEEN